MKVVLFAEGRSDLAVLTNILKGKLGIEASDIHYALPEYSLDETDLHTYTPEQYSSWTLVKQACVGKEELSSFFDYVDDPSRFAIIQIDAFECFMTGYDVVKPDKKELGEEEYSTQLRSRIIQKIQVWLSGEYLDKIAYAICIEEVEAWLLTQFDKTGKDTCRFNNPKKELNSALSKQLGETKTKQIYQMDAFARNKKLSKDFTKPTKLFEYSKYNHSLKDFLESLDAFEITN